MAIAVVPVGLYLFNGDWHGLFYVAGTMCIAIAILVLIFGADTPQSVGLPAIEVYKGYTTAAEIHEQEFTAKRDIFQICPKQQMDLANSYRKCFCILCTLRYAELVNILPCSSQTHVYNYRFAWFCDV